MLRELVQSRSVMAVLVGLYVLSTLGAIPVLTLRPSGDSKTVAASIDALHASYCSCVSCSPENCCCAMLAPDAGDDGGLTMLGFSCQPTVTWFLALLPPAVVHAEFVTTSETHLAERVVSPELGGADRAIGVPTPPPKPAA